MHREIIYVCSRTGSDDNGDGSKEKPYRTILTAASKINRVDIFGTKIDREDGLITIQRDPKYAPDKNR